MSTLTGTTGNDSLNVNSSITLVKAGSGTDTVVFSGDYSDYSFSQSDSFVPIITNNSTNQVVILHGVEQILFDDDLVDISMSNDGEFFVHAISLNDQDDSFISALAGGGFVVTWSSYDPLFLDWDVYAQLYDAEGNALGVEIMGSDTLLLNQYSAKVSALRDGGYIVTWDTFDSSLTDWGIYAQRFDASGYSVGNEFQINTSSSFSSFPDSPAIASLVTGGFVVSWESFELDGDGWGVFAQIYDTDGNTKGGEFQVNSTISSDQFYSDNAALENGGFVVVWESFEQDGDGYGVYGQRFDSNGDTAGAEFRVNTTTLDWQDSVAIAGLAGGGFVATWDSYNPITLDWNVFAQRYGADGNIVGTEFQVNTTTANAQAFSSVAALDDGGFVVTWESDGQDGSFNGVFGQIFDTSGVPVGAEFQVNSTTYSNQQNSQVSGLSDGGFVVTWDSYDVYNLDWDVVAQRYDADGKPFGVSTESVVYDSVWSDEVYGSDGDDNLSGSSGDDYIITGNGVDIVNGGSGDDGINAFTSTGSKTLYGGEGDDIIWGGEDDDYIYGNEGDDYWLEGFSGDDIINGGLGNDEIYGSAGNDTLSGDSGFDWLYGGEGDDTYLVTDQWDYISDNEGNNNVVVSVDFYKTPSTVSEISYIDDAKSLPYWIDALTYDSLSATRYHLEETERQFYYMFPESALVYYDTEDLFGWAEANDSMKQVFEHVVSTLENVIDIDFVSTDNPLQLNTITLSTNTQSYSSGYAFSPDWMKDSDYYLSSDIFIDSAHSQPSLTDPNFDLEVIVHELGHALGLKHPFSETDVFGQIGEGPYLDVESEENTYWTVMSYTEATDSYSEYFSPFDIAALHYIYGVSSEANAGDTTHLFDGTEGVFVYDGQGVDVIDASTADSPTTISLSEGDWSYIGDKSDLISTANQLTINFSTQIENAIGGNFDDTIVGNSLGNVLTGGKGDDSLIGGKGDDNINGEQGNDNVVGGEGEDTAIFSGVRSNYSIGLSAMSSDLRVTSSTEGVDMLTSIEILNFSDTSLNTDQLQLDTGLSCAVAKINDDYLLDNATVSYIKNDVVLGVSSTIEDGDIKMGQSTDDENGMWFHQNIAFDEVKLNDDAYDFDINISDAIDVLRHIVGLEAMTIGSSSYHAADIDNDNDINISDAIDILRHVVDLEVINSFDLLDSTNTRATLLNAVSEEEAPEWVIVANGDVDMSGSFAEDYIVTSDLL